PVRRFGFPAVTSATSGVVEHHLDRLGGLGVEERVRLSRARERDAVRDEVLEDQPSEQLRRQVETPLAVPPRGEQRIDPPDLRAHQKHATTSPWRGFASSTTLVAGSRFARNTPCSGVVRSGRRRTSDPETTYSS